VNAFDNMDRLRSAPVNALKLTSGRGSCGKALKLKIGLVIASFAACSVFTTRSTSGTPGNHPLESDCSAKITRTNIADAVREFQDLTVWQNNAAYPLAEQLLQCKWSDPSYANTHAYRWAYTWDALDSLINLVDENGILRSEHSLKLLGVGESEHIPSICYYKYGVKFDLLNAYPHIPVAVCPGLFHENILDQSEKSNDVFNVEVLNAEGKIRYPYEDSEFHIVTLLEVLEHLREDPIQCLSEINRVLKQDGHLLITTPNGNAFNAILNVYAKKSPLVFSPFNEDGITHSKEYSVSELRQLVEAAGFEIVAHETFSPYHLTDSNQMRDPDVQFLLAFSKLCQRMELNMTGHAHLLVARKVHKTRYLAIEPLYTFTRET